MSTAFETEMGVIPEISKAVEEMEWNLPTDIQSEAVPLILGGTDVLMAAETGSGKTGAFCLPVLQIVYETMQESDKKINPVTYKHSPIWKMNVYDRGNAMAVAEDGLLCQSRDKGGWHGCRANKGVKGSGKYYFEATALDDGICRVGWSTLEAKLDLGTCPFGYGFGGTGKKSNCKNFETYGESYGNGDTIGCMIDLDKKEMSWSKNGQHLGIGYRIAGSQHGESFFPAIGFKNAEMKLEFGDGEFKYLPKGFKAVKDAPSNCVMNTTKLAVGSQIVPKKRAGPLAVIIEPSRELAEQTFKQLHLFKKYLTDPNPRILLAVGGVDIKQQRSELETGVEIVVGTPGRLADFISNQMLKLDWVRYFILDECDGLLSQGHKDVIDMVHQKLPRIGPRGERLQVIVCSATLHSFDVKKLADSIMHFPVWIDLKGQDSVPDTVHHVVCVVDPATDVEWYKMIGNKNILTDGVHQRDRISPASSTPETMSEGVKILKALYVMDAIRKLKIDKSLIFCRTKVDCDNMEKMFIMLGGGNRNKDHQFSCVCLHGDRPPRERKANLEKFKNNEVRFLICTDVAARGLDIKGLPYVINVTLPDEKENYVHRIGRVGRAERMGLAISIVSKVKEKVWYHSNCNTRGKGCYNTELTDRGGCCIWYNEQQILANVEEHLGCTIDQVNRQFNIPINEFDGKVVYGQKVSRKLNTGETHVDILAPAVRELANLEKKCQDDYLNLMLVNYGF